jgi:hypothetical protein
MSQVPEALQHLHGLIALGLAKRRGIAGKDAIELATDFIELLQAAHGGNRLGSRGIYIPAINRWQTRRDRIREMMGPSPHSRKRVRKVAEEVGCSEMTVWRAVRCEKVK